MKIVLKVLGMVLALAVVLVGVAAVAVVMRAEDASNAALPSDAVLYDPVFQSAAEQSAEHIIEIIEDTGLPSISVAVGVEGELVWTMAAGWSDVKGREGASAATRYRVGSVAKAFTTAAMGTLMDEQALRLEDSYHRWVPEFPQKAHPFTLRQLAAHQAGVRHYAPGFQGMTENFHQTQYDNVADALVMVQDDPLLFEPGHDFEYSSFGYNMLSLALERAAGTPFLQLMDERVYQPAGMTTTEPDHQDRPMSEVAAAYILWDSFIVRAPGVNNSYKWAGGGFIATPSDLVAFGNAMLDDRLVSRNTRNQLWTPQPLRDGNMNPQNYGLGFRVNESNLGLRVSHGGSSVGGSSWLMILPEQQFVLGFATNTTPMTLERNVRGEMLDIARRFLDARPDATP